MPPMDIRDRIVEMGRKPASQFTAHPLNWRRHPQAQRDALAGVLGSIGWAGAVIENRRTGRLIDGHERVWQALRAGDADVPYVQVDVDEAEERVLLATFDPIGDMAETDRDALAALLAEVETDDGAVRALLVEIAERENIDNGGLEDAPPAQVDRAEQLRHQWGTERGQVWQVGRHRVMCGDATNGDDMAALLGEAKPYLMVTDPPYGVEYDAAWRNELSDAARRIGLVSNDDRMEWGDVFALWPCEVLYAWSPSDYIIVTGGAIQRAGFEIRSEIIWSKPHFPISRGHYTYRHEPCWYAVRKGADAQWIGAANECTVWEIALDRNCEGGHSTQKPLECMAHPIRNHEGDVADPFLGSGTTLVACEQLNRVGYGMEIEPKYVAVSLQRLADMGLAPVRVTT